MSKKKIYLFNSMNDFIFKGSADSNFSRRESDFDLDERNRETLRRDAERSAALQLERAKV